MRVTLGIATYNRDTYLAAAIESGLSQDLAAPFELLVVVDGSTNPAIDGVLDGFAGEPRLRVVRHERNLGIAAAYNTFVSEGRGELIAMIGDDDLCLPGRLRRQVEVFDRHPDTGVVHGDAIVIDGAGRQTGVWNSREFSRSALLQAFFRSHNHLVDPTRMVHRRVYEEVGGYDERFPLANDFDFWLRAVQRFRFRHCPGGPLTAVRRHGSNTSDESQRAQELADVEGALSDALDRFELRELVPELDWAVLDADDAERQARLRLAEQLERRLLPVPGLAARLRSQATAAPAAPAARPAAGRGRLMITAFGWNDSGGGTTVPRLAAKELARRGWDVTVFHAATAITGTGIPYELREWTEDGVRLIGVHNRPHGLFDLGNPARELDDPPITAAFAAALDRLKPDVIHFHNLHNLGAALIDQAASHGVPAFYTTHNYWLVCPRAYLLDAAGAICAGPGDGAKCAACVGSVDTAGHERRLAAIRSAAERGLHRILAVSDAVRQTLLAAGYPDELLEVVRQAMPHDAEIWEEVGRDRVPGRASRDSLTVAFLGSAYPHKGPQLLVEAAQLTSADIRVAILGEVPDRFVATLRALDTRSVVDIHGAFSPSEIGGLLAGVDAAALPSMWWDCAPLAAAECRAARVPLLVPKLGGLAEVIVDDHDGLTFDALSATDLARQLDRLASEPGLLERLQGAIDPPPTFGAYVDTLERLYLTNFPPQAAAADASGGKFARAVRWQGDFGKPTSLSIINDRVAERLRSPTQRVDVSGAAIDPPLAHPAAVEVRHSWPPNLTRPEAGRLAAIVPWEFGAVPVDWLTQIDRNVDELWVPSEFVRAMYVEAGVDPERVVAIPNGVELDTFTPDGPVYELGAHPGTARFLFVGGLIWRKGPDVLLDAYRRAFPDRDDVELVIKDFGKDGVYRGADRSAVEEHARSETLPRVTLIDDDLTTAEVASLYRACDVLVHPYRGEGFAMPVLEAMACGRPVIVTAGGPTDEFCPLGAGWRVRSSRVHFPENRIDALVTNARPWVLEPDRDHLVELLRTAAAAGPEERCRRGQRGAEAAAALSWDAVAARYQERIDALARRRPKLASKDPADPFPLEEQVDLRVLATPAWRGEDRLADLLKVWSERTTRASSACLYLLADPQIDGSPQQLEQRVLDAATELEDCADINLLMEPATPTRDRGLHAAVNVYVPLHDACGGHARMARRVLGIEELSAELAPTGARPATAGV